MLLKCKIFLLQAPYSKSALIQYSLCWCNADINTCVPKMRCRCVLYGRPLSTVLQFYFIKMLSYYEKPLLYLFRFDPELKPKILFGATFTAPLLVVIDTCQT